MIDKRILILFLFCCTSILAQLKGKVVDEKNQPIPYVNIWAKGQDIGTTSDEQGNFSLAVSPNTELILTSIGFETYEGKLLDSANIVLKEKIHQMQEVAISSKRKATVILNDYKKEKLNAGFVCGVKPWIVARFFPYNQTMENYPFIKKIFFKAETEIPETQMLLHLYKVNPDGSPGTELLTENHFLNIRKGNKNNTIDLDKMNIQIPLEGIFIGFEWLIIENNKMEYTYTLPTDFIQKKYKGVKYAPSIKAYLVNSSNTRIFSKGRWSNNHKIPIDFVGDKKFVGKEMELAISLELTN
ncbi:carboxypeptidase-like regulatory domain-containing protein [Flavobacterium sp.]|uniref:carboxypeptidase-like regulatory domain-containing protein n=1 Tax=Flavobacterium sp. TaxID=239 RepID=UPI003D0A46F8